jgi:hypothetical protein
MQKMGEIIMTILVLFVGAAVGIGGIVLLLYVFSS